MMKTYLNCIFICIIGISCQTKQLNQNVQENQAKLELYKLYSILSCECKGVVESTKDSQFYYKNFRDRKSVV